jgi:uncharacterized protein (DUF934 family)
MPKLIRDGEIVTDDSWLPADASADSAADNQICTLAQWQARTDKSGTAVQLEPADELDSLVPELANIELIAINFPAFADGRGFSYARELREKGFQGELRAVGNFIRDQLTYLSRVGFNAFQFGNESELDGAADSLSDFSEHYQASIDQPQPLFRRRA